MFMYLHRASRHSSTTFNEGFPCFSSVSRQMPGYNSQIRGTAPHSCKIFVFFYVLFVLCRSVYCLCVNVYCTTATGWQPTLSLTNISYHGILSTLSIQCAVFRMSVLHQTTKNSCQSILSFGLIVLQFFFQRCKLINNYFLYKQCFSSENVTCAGLAKRSFVISLITMFHLVY
jgi:hypothetical protein